MATISLSTDLDVQGKYKALIDQSLSEGSVYIRAKETLMDMFDKGYIKDDQIAEVVSNVIAGANQTMMTSAMSTALQWANAEKDLVLKKRELEAQLDTIDSDTAVKVAQAKKLENEDIALQADTIRKYGTPSVLNGEVVALPDTGLMYEEVQLAKEKVVSEQKAQALSDAKIKEGYAGINKIVSDTYANYGMFSGYTVSADGVTGITDTTPTSHKPLSKLQAVIAEEQAKGYTYNAWANVASGLGSTVGVALTSGTDVFGTNKYTDLLTDWSGAIKNLKAIKAPTFN